MAVMVGAGIVSSVPLLWATYVVPVVLGYWVVPNYHLWQEGFFQNIADKVAPWLGVMMTVAAAVSNFGMANALIATLARTCWAMALEEGTVSPHTRHTRHSLSAWLQVRHRSCPDQWRGRGRRGTARWCPWRPSCSWA